jgi:Fic family protein
MLEFLNLYNSKAELFTKLILSHFVFEYVHPFYNGNGRFGRFLFTKKLFKETNSICSFLISTAFEKERTKYYKAFKAADDRYQFGCLNQYLKIITEILNDYFDKTLNTLKDNINRLNNLIIPEGFTKSEIKVYKLLGEATIYSTYGVSNEEIMDQTGISKRTLIYSLNKFKASDMIEDTKVGKTTYHKLVER